MKNGRNFKIRRKKYEKNKRKRWNPCGCREREKLFIQHGIRLLDHVYCHLENKKRKLNSSKGRTMPVKQAIALPLCAFAEKVKHNHRRGGP